MEDRNSLKFIFQYDFLPKSAMPRLIIKLHPDIKEALRWRTGVVLENADFKITAVVRADEEEKNIFIQIKGEQKREYLSVIRHALKEINKSFQHLHYEELIPLPIPEEILKKYNHPEQIPEMYRRTVSYGFLSGYERAGKEEYFDGETGVSYSVPELLDSVVRAEERKLERRGRDHLMVSHQEVYIEKLPTENRESQKYENIKRLTKEISQLKIRFQKEENLKKECDEEAEKKVRRFTWRFVGLHIFVFITWVVLIFRFGWETMEKWTYLAALVGVVIQAVILAVTGRFFNSRESRDRRRKKEREKIYRLRRFSMEEYESLKAELAKAEDLHQQLL